MDENEKYNGWTNYETWNVHLWLTSDPGTYESARRIAQTGDEEALSDWVEGDVPNEVTGMYPDLVTHALARVNWREVWEALRED